MIPFKYRDEVLWVAHDGVAGYLRVSKMLNRILQHFFWLGLRRDVVCFCKTCSVCQFTGKPNQIIPPIPLYPLPVMGQPFDHVIVDSVGPLVCSRNSHQYLLTTVCAATQFPEVVPLRKITTRVVMKELLKFFSLCFTKSHSD